MLDANMATQAIRPQRFWVFDATLMSEFRKYNKPLVTVVRRAKKRIPFPSIPTMFNRIAGHKKSTANNGGYEEPQ